MKEVTAVKLIIFATSAQILLMLADQFFAGDSMFSGNSAPLYKMGVMIIMAGNLFVALRYLKLKSK